ncbi:MAG: preprotein translocase subunit YajC [Clostridiaceae bacterium]|nr:preprotein translocase subunit YajC [Clostridiaceae bacterium]
MNRFFYEAAQAADATAASPSLQDMLPLLLMSGAFVFVIYFFMIRPQRKRDKELKAQVNSMTVGDRIVTIGGVVGTIANIRDDEITIATSIANTMITFKKTAIGSVVKKETAT